MKLASRNGLFGAALAVLTAVAGPAVATELRLGSGFGEKHSSTVALRTVFADEVASRTAGRYSVSVFPSSELGQAIEMVNQAQAGINFGVFVSSAFYNGQVPQLGVTNLPFAFPDRETAYALFDGPFGESLKPLFEEKGLVVLGFMELGYRNITNSRRPVTTPEDVAGLKIRLQNNPVHIETFKMLGASPTSIDASELFAALSQRVVDGQENPYAVIRSFNMFEAGQTFTTDTGHFYDTIVFAVSKSMLDAMTPEDRAAVVEAGRLATLAQRAQAASEDAANLEALKALGMNVTHLTEEQRKAFRDATRPVWDMVGDTLGQDLLERFVKALDTAG
jgi:TRAP-type transport system periplasmic protein